MDNDFQEILQTFVAETEENLRTVEEAVLLLETSPGAMEALHAGFRAAHTIKGNASNLGLQGVTALAHVLEDLLERLRERTVPVTRGVISMLLEGVDALRGLVPFEVAAVSGTDLFAEPAPNLAAAREGDGAENGAARARILRVGIDTLDRLLNMTGEIAIARGRMKQLLAEAGPEAQEISDVHQEVDRLYLELQQLALDIRLVPVGPVFRQHIRTARDVGLAHGKVVRVVIEGEDVEVDTTVIEHLKDPLTHLIRNAIDHGIEPGPLRAERGKEPGGTITLRAFHNAGSVVVQVGDDGAGLDVEKILQRARALGLVGETERPSTQEIHQLIFRAGFSTANTITDLSGRGVGMDVVRRSVEALRGTVAIDSRPGAGTTVTIRLPLTLAIIDGFGVGVGDESYIIPLHAVVECLDLIEEERYRGERTGIINLRGEVLPYLRLRRLFALDGATPARENVVVVRHEGGLAGLAVDVVHGETQAVIKPLGRMLRDLPGVLGSTILGNGRVALILDVAAIMKETREGEALANHAAGVEQGV